MRTETILDAMERAYERVDWLAPQPAKFERQYRAFRARILARDAEQRREIAEWETYHECHMGDIETRLMNANFEINRLRAELDAQT